ncbi:MAG: SUMF1/EgtB/PvdO family nonheme iron enzyme [Gammaproteobacteria bacterium]|nr:SUMF1/EgtB/PvdO family nonheme iron enzyme [Gammaproteobacteria bacterium]
MKTAIFAQIIAISSVVTSASDSPTDVVAVDPTPVFSVILDRLEVGGYGPEMVVVPIGSPKVEDCIAAKDCDETITDIVSSMLPSSFAISRYEITFEHYDRFCEATGRAKPDDNGWGRASRPVIFVAWKDALAYVDWLTEQTGFKYHLPSVIEWEFAARAGRHTTYWWGVELETNRANCSDCGSPWSNVQTAPVASFPPNPWGIYDMHGNVGEFTRDCAMKKRRFRLSKKFPVKLNELSSESKFLTNCEWIRIKGSSWLSTDTPTMLWKSDNKNAYLWERIVAYPERYKSAGKGIRVVREL